VPLLYPLLGVIGVPVSHEKDGITALKSVFFLSNNLAHFLVPMLILTVAWALSTRGWWRLVACLSVTIVAVELVLSQTRGAWIGAVIGVIIVCLLVNRRVAVAGTLMVVVAALTVPAINTRLADLRPDPDQPRTESSFAWRVSQWERLLPHVSDSPVTGSGPGAGLRITGKQPHNDYVKAVVETGVVGLGAYVWMLGAGAVTSWRAWLRVRRLRSRGSPGVSPVVQATFAAIAAYSIAVMLSAVGENLIDNVTFLWSTMPLYALAHWALTCRPRRLSIKE